MNRRIKKCQKCKSDKVLRQGKILTLKINTVRMAHERIVYNGCGECGHIWGFKVTPMDDSFRVAFAEHRCENCRALTPYTIENSGRVAYWCGCE